MDDRAAAIAYLAEGFALLRKHGLYGKSDEPHRFAMDRALANFADKRGRTLCLQTGDTGDTRGRDTGGRTFCDTGGRTFCVPGSRGEGAAEAAAALQALYEAKRLVTARSSLEGRRIILGDWFMSLAVSLALPLGNARLSGLMSEELRNVGTNANSINRRVSKQDFCKTIDRFTDALLHQTDGQTDGDVPCVCTQGETDGDVRTKGDGSSVRTKGDSSSVLEIKNNVISGAFPADNKLLAAIGSGYHKTAAKETRRALSLLEDWFAARYASEAACETDGWIYGAIMSGGKRMRPILVRLCAGLGAEDSNGGRIADETTVVNIMSTIELMHSASLVHDDIVDRSPMRRSRATINAEKGDGYAAMCGFIMIADAIRLIGAGASDRLTELLSSIPKKMCGGELHQLDVENKPELQSEEEYFRRIACKTAALIEGSCVSGAIAGGADESTIDNLSEFGRALGLLFQLRDDLLDYGPPHKSGKPVSQDMERGVYSLPLLRAKETLLSADPEEHERLDAVLRKHIKEPSDFRYLNKIAESSGGISYAIGRIEEQARAALSSLVLLPQNAWTEALSLIVISLTENYSHEGFLAYNKTRFSNE